MGRYKLGPQGAYYDPNDSGPNQASPDQIQAIQQTPQTIQAPPSSGGYQPPTGGINPGGATTMPMHPPPPNPFTLPQLSAPGPYKAGPAWPGGGFMMPQTPIGERWWNRGLPQSLWTDIPPNDFGLPKGGLGQLPGQIFSGGLQSQGGPLSDPRWTNGTWGGATLNTIGLAR